MLLRPQLLLLSPRLLTALSQRPLLLHFLAVTCWAATGTQQKKQATMVAEARVKTHLSFLEADVT